MMLLGFAAVIVGLCWQAGSVQAAEYLGRDIDGEIFVASAYSYDTGKYYDVEVTFSGGEATLYFSSGGYLLLTLDDEEIDDPHHISAFDYERGVHWNLDVDGID